MWEKNGKSSPNYKESLFARHNLQQVLLFRLILLCVHNNYYGIYIQENKFV